MRKWMKWTPHVFSIRTFDIWSFLGVTQVVHKHIYKLKSFFYYNIDYWLFLYSMLCSCMSVCQPVVRVHAESGSRVCLLEKVSCPCLCYRVSRDLFHMGLYLPGKASITNALNKALCSNVPSLPSSSSSFILPFLPSQFFPLGNWTAGPYRKEESDAMRVASFQPKSEANPTSIFLAATIAIFLNHSSCQTHIY